MDDATTILILLRTNVTSVGEASHIDFLHNSAEAPEVSIMQVLRLSIVYKSIKVHLPVKGLHNERTNILEI